VFVFIRKRVGLTVNVCVIKDSEKIICIVAQLDIYVQQVEIFILNLILRSDKTLFVTVSVGLESVC